MHKKWSQIASWWFLFYSLHALLCSLAFLILVQLNNCLYFFRLGDVKDRNWNCWNRTILTADVNGIVGVACGQKVYPAMTLYTTRYDYKSDMTKLNPEASNTERRATFAKSLLLLHLMFKLSLNNTFLNRDKIWRHLTPVKVLNIQYVHIYISFNKVCLRKIEEDL